MIDRRCAVRLTMLVALVPAAADAQDPSPPLHPAGEAHAQIELVASRYADTPNGLGLLTTARAEAEIAMQHAQLATRDSLYLDGMKRHVEHALHALDPSLAPLGPGMGYGVRRAAEGILHHVQLAGAAEDASDNLRTHAGYIAGAARSTLERLDRVATLAERVRSASSLAETAATVRQLEATVRAVWLGSDADRDGRVVWVPPEGGLRQAHQHMTLLRRGEGLSTQEALPR